MSDEWVRGVNCCYMCLIYYMMVFFVLFLSFNIIIDGMCLRRNICKEIVVLYIYIYIINCEVFFCFRIFTLKMVKVVNIINELLYIIYYIFKKLYINNINKYIIYVKYINIDLNIDKDKL